METHLIGTASCASILPYVSLYIKTVLDIELHVEWVTNCFGHKLLWSQIALVNPTVNDIILKIGMTAPLGPTPHKVYTQAFCTEIVITGNVE